MALHSATLGGLGQVAGPLESACGGAGSNVTSNPSQALATATLRPTYIKYAPTPYAPPGGDPYANGGSGLVPYVEEKTGHSSVSAPVIQMQQFPPQSQRLVHPPSIIDAGYYMQPCWNAVAPGPSGVLGTMIGGQPQQSSVKQQQSTFEESLMNNGCTMVVSCSSSMPSCATVGCSSDRRLITPPMGPPLPTTPMPGGPYGPRFAPTQIYHNSASPTACIPQQPSGTYMSMPIHPHSPTCLSPGFAGAPTINDHRLYMSSPQGNVGLGSRMPTASVSMRASTSMPFGYFQMAPPPTEGVTAATMCPATVPHGPPLLHSGHQGPTGSKSEPITTKKKRTKITKSRGATTRGGNGRGTGGGTVSRVVTVSQPSAASLVGPPPTQIMGPGVILSTGVSAPPQSPLWAPRPSGPIMTNGTMLPMAPPPFGNRPVPCGLSPKVIGPPLPSPNTVVHAPVTPHQYQPTAGSPAVINSTAPPSSQSYAPPVPQSLPLGPAAPTAERLVCPITNGTVVRPMMLQLDEDQMRKAPNTLQVRSFEFDVSKNHLETIVERPDLDIVVCSHLVDEPLQVCHWPPEAVHIRFNGTVFQLDRSTTADGQPAHRVCGIKALCRPSRNVIEVFLSPSSSRSPSPYLPNHCLKDHRFALFMAHMPAVSMVLDGLLRRVPDESLALTKLITASWRSHQANNVVGSSQDQCQPTTTTPPPPLPIPIPNQSFAAQISLVCPVFRTRMQIPGRLVGCHHLEVFDMEAYLHREAIWSRLLCPICGNGNPAVLDNLYIDYFLLNILQLIPKSISSIHVSSDGFWRLSPPLIWQLPPGAEQWQPIIGPPTYAFAIALKVGPTCLIASPQQSHQESVAINGLEAAGTRSCGAMVTAGCQQNLIANSYRPTFNQWNADVPPNSNCPIQVVTSASPKPMFSSASTVAFSADVQQSVPASGEMLAQTEEQALPNSMPDLRVAPETASNQVPLPRSLPTTPTILKLSSPISTSKPTSGKGSGMGERGIQSYTTSPQPSAKRPKVFQRHPTDEEVRWAFDGLTDLNYFNNAELIRLIESLP